MSTVFVSSTCYDLLDLRSEMESHIAELGLTPIMSDRVTSLFEVVHDANSIETCLINVRKADVFICVLSQRYGRALETPFEPVSATHLEYREAVKLGKPIRFYVRDRLLAEYDLWRACKTTEAQDALPLRWVQKEQRRIFELMAEHFDLYEAARDGDRTNWMWPFRDSIELKGRIALDLQIMARKATMRRLIRQGEIPAIAVTPTSNSGSTPNFSITLSLWNVGRLTATNIKWTDESGRWRPVGVIPPGRPSDNHSYVLNVPDARIDTEGKLLIAYDTATGYRVHDTHGVSRHPNANVTVRLKTRELLTADDYEII